MATAVGKPLFNVLKITIRANQPTLLIGGTGVGKSQIVKAVADDLKIQYIVRDLSLMEPSDLVGMPQIKDGRTHFVPPAFLPANDGSKGILMLEELNRAPQYMLAPTLELLTSRKLNDYVLPAGWVPMAAINPHTDDQYVGTRQLDAALLARFTRVHVFADYIEWLVWARQRKLNDAILSFVQMTPDVFSASDSNPRAWEALSRIVSELDANTADKATIRTCITGTVGELMGEAFLSFLNRKNQFIPDAKDVLDNYAKWRDAVQAMKKRNDVAAMHGLVEAVIAMYQDVSAIPDHATQGRWRTNLLAMKEDVNASFKSRIAGALK